MRPCCNIALLLFVSILAVVNIPALVAAQSYLSSRSFIVHIRTSMRANIIVMDTPMESSICMARQTLFRVSLIYNEFSLT